MLSSRKFKHFFAGVGFLGLMGFSLLQVWQQLRSQDQVLGETANTKQLDSSNLVNMAGFEQAVVKRVVDGDTIELSDGRRLRYIGIDTPETKHPQKGVECFGWEAYQKNKELVEGKTVFLEKDVNDTDRYGRLLRYVWLDEKMVNLALVELGFAYAASYPPDVKHQAEFQQAQTQARAYQKGLWAGCELQETSSDESTSEQLDQLNQDIQNADEQMIEKVQGVSDEIVEEGCVIKGNISENGKFYHLPTCPSYFQVIISEDKGEQWFCSEEAAVQAGWQKATNCPN